MTDVRCTYFGIRMGEKFDHLWKTRFRNRREREEVDDSGYMASMRQVWMVPTLMNRHIHLHGFLDPLNILKARHILARNRH
jgi:hypothetical protein